jgi:uncharacterized SAM-binding protein YcdF (DUF218 family)
VTAVVRSGVFTLAGLGLLMVAVSATPLVSWWASTLAGPWNDPGGEVLIVLGGSTLDNGTIGGSSYWRAIYGARAFREGGFHEVVVTGGPAVAAAAPPIGAFLECQGVPRANIHLESKSINTRENALYTRELLRGIPGTKVLLTSDYHMYRAHRAFLKVGLDVAPRPFPDIRKRALSWTGRWPAFLDLLQETAKIAYYRVKGWI